MKFLAYAKINIRLKVLGKTEKNYHNLSMVNAKISLADEIEIIEGNENKVSYSIEELNHLQDNLCLNVLNEMVANFNLKKRYHIYIKKNIPMGAGLGGGSSDVACIINAIDKLHNLNLSLDDKIKVGLKYGADVAYCLIDNVALVEGIGEKITLLNVCFKERVVVVYPNIFVSTKDVFSKVKSYSVENQKDEIVKYIKNKDYKSLLINDLETPSFELNSNLKEIKDTLSLIGNTIMSGSGSSMLVFVNNDEQLKEIIKVYPDFFVVDAYIL